MNKGGFTLIEVLFVAIFTVLITGFVITNFSRSRNELNLMAADLVGDIRLAQSRAISGTIHDGFYRCGYGVAFQENRYLLYAGPDVSSIDCDDIDVPLYNEGVDEGDIVFEVPLILGLEILAPGGDVFFEPPLPTTYLNGEVRSGPGAEPLEIRIRQGSASCTSPSPTCRVITIYASGQVRVQ